MKAVEIYDRLKTAFGLLGGIYGKLEGDIRPDTALAIGEALGNISKAKALVGRDIDDEAASRRTGVGGVVSAKARAPDGEQL